jgi:hypothetical protein
MKRLMIDLFAGLGGASEAFVQHPDWNVVRIDNNPDLIEHVPDLQLMSIEEVHANLSVYQGMKIDLIWASPPCTDFSNGYSSPKSKWARENPDQEYKPDMTLLKLTIEIIEALKPRYWIIENVKGSQKYFNELLGVPKVIHDPYYLWGNFPLFSFKLQPGHRKIHDEDRLGRSLRSNVRALIPIELSEACRQSIQYQTKLDQYSVNVKSQRRT